MLTDIPQMLPPFSPVAAEVRPYVGEGFPESFERLVFYYKSGSAFLKLQEKASVTSVAHHHDIVLDYKEFLNTDDAALVTHEAVRANVEKACFDLRLSKSALSEILGVSRQTIYDWLSGKNENFKPENISKVEWLNELAQRLDDDAKGSLWLWRDKKLSNGLTIKNVLGNAQIPPQDLAVEINAAFSKGKNIARLVSASQEASGRDLVDKSAPFANND